MLFGYLIETGKLDSVVAGYVFAAVLMICASIVAWIFGVDAENKSLEEVAPPLSSFRSHMQ